MIEGWSGDKENACLPDIGPLLCKFMIYLLISIYPRKKPKVPGNILQVTQHGGFSSENPPSPVHIPTTMERSTMNSQTSVECSILGPPSASPTSTEVNISLGLGRRQVASSFHLKQKYYLQITLKSAEFIGL